MSATGRPRFSSLRRDLIELNGDDLRRVPLEVRQSQSVLAKAELAVMAKTVGTVALEPVT